MRIYLFILILIFSNVFSQKTKKHELLLPYRDGNLWGLCDTLGVVKVKPTLPKIEYFSVNRKFYGNYVIRKDKKISVIDQYKKILMPETAEYDSIFINENGKETAVFKNGKMGLLIDFKPFIPAEYDRIRDEDNGSYEVTIDDLKGLINSKGKLIIPVEYQRISQSYSKEDKENTQFVWEAKGLFSSKKFYDAIFVQQNSNEEGNPPPPPIAVQEAKRVSDKVKEVEKKLMEKYDDADIYERDQIIFVEKGGKVGILSYPEEKEIFKTEYDDIDIIGYEKNVKVFLLKKNGKHGIQLENGKVKIPVEYDDIDVEYSFGRHFILYKNGKKGVFLLNTIYKPIEAKYKNIKQINPIQINNSWQFGLFEVETTEGKKGIVGENGIEYFKN